MSGPLVSCLLRSSATDERPTQVRTTSVRHSQSAAKAFILLFWMDSWLVSLITLPHSLIDRSAIQSHTVIFFLSAPVGEGQFLFVLHLSVLCAYRDFFSAYTVSAGVQLTIHCWDHLAQLPLGALPFRDDKPRGDPLPGEGVQNAASGELPPGTLWHHARVLEEQAWQPTHLWLLAERPWGFLHGYREPVSAAAMILHVQRPVLYRYFFLIAGSKHISCLFLPVKESIDKDLKCWRPPISVCSSKWQ